MRFYEKILMSLLLPLHAAAGSPNALPANFHVMSFNVKGLPSILLSSSWSPERYDKISSILSGRLKEGNGPDVVMLQEAFSEGSLKILRNSGYSHIAAGPGPASVLGVSSGLFILSRYKILHEASRTFGLKNCLSWDCFSNKGVQMARIEVPGISEPVEIFNTHLQAGRTDSGTRQRQVEILVEFFRKEHRPGAAVVFAGDFNFRPGMNQKSYEDFDRALGLQHAARYCMSRGCAKGNDDGWHGLWERAVDHQFFQAKGSATLTPVHVERTYREAVDGMRLSDHPAHEVLYQLRMDHGKLAGEPQRELHPGGGGAKPLPLFSAPARSETSAP